MAIVCEIEWKPKIAARGHVPAMRSPRGAAPAYIHASISATIAPAFARHTVSQSRPLVGGLMLQSVDAVNHRPRVPSQNSECS